MDRWYIVQDESLDLRCVEVKRRAEESTVCVRAEDGGRTTTAGASVSSRPHSVLPEEWDPDRKTRTGAGIGRRRGPRVVLVVGVIVSLLAGGPPHFPVLLLLELPGLLDNDLGGLVHVLVRYHFDAADRAVVVPAEPLNNAFLVEHVGAVL